MNPTIPVQRLAHHGGGTLPEYETPGSAGMDIAAMGDDLPITLAPGDRALISSGLKMALPVGFEAQIRPRSGMALKQGVTVLNAPGTIDSDYRGEIKVLLINLGQSPVTIDEGDRIAQMVIAPIVQISWSETAALEDTVRGAGGFGSTGKTAGQNGRADGDGDISKGPHR